MVPPPVLLDPPPPPGLAASERLVSRPMANRGSTSRPIRLSKVNASMAFSPREPGGLRYNKKAVLQARRPCARAAPRPGRDQLAGEISPAAFVRHDSDLLPRFHANLPCNAAAGALQ